MKSSLLALAAAAAGLASSQCPSSIPQCAQSCLVIAASSVGCGEADYACQCTNQHQTQITSNAITCVLAACGRQVATNEVLPAAQALCSAINAGESCSSASAGSTSSSATSSSTASSGSAPGTTTASGTTGTAATSTTTTTGASSSSSSSSAGAGGTTTAAGGTGTGASASASASASSTAGAAPALGPAAGSLAVAVLGALAML